MAIVATYKFGGATVNIHDDYIVKDPVEKQRILDRVNAILDASDERIYREKLARDASVGTGGG